MPGRSRRYADPDLIAAVMADGNASATINYRDKSIDNARIYGVTPEYVNFTSYDASAAR